MIKKLWLPALMIGALFAILFFLLAALLYSLWKGNLAVAVAAVSLGFCFSAIAAGGIEAIKEIAGK
jgi:hypothetical protein